jgi:hypothetical protein
VSSWNGAHASGSDDSASVPGVSDLVATRQRPRPSRVTTSTPNLARRALSSIVASLSAGVVSAIARAEMRYQGGEAASFVHRARAREFEA